MGSVNLAPGFRVEVKNKAKDSGFFGGKKDDMIGLINLDLTNTEDFTKLRDDSDLTQSLEPKFYTLMRNGAIKGKLLAFFSYCVCSKHEISSEKFRKCFSITQESQDLDFSVIGLRNLDEKLPNPRVCLSLKPYGAKIEFKPVDKSTLGRGHTDKDSKNEVSRIQTTVSEKHNG
jgi:hypothetical protein